MKKLSIVIMLIISYGCGTTAGPEEVNSTDDAALDPSGTEKVSNEPSVTKQTSHLQPPAPPVQGGMLEEKLDWAVANFSLTDAQTEQLRDSAYAEQAEVALNYALQAYQGQQLVEGFGLIPGLERVGQLYQWYQLLVIARNLAGPLLDNLDVATRDDDAAASIVAQSDRRLTDMFSELFSSDMFSQRDNSRQNSDLFELPRWQELLVALLG